MITKVKITNRKNTPVRYLNSDGNHILTNGSEYEFKSGVNVIVGPNGSGKSTLLRLIREYLLIDKNRQDIRNITNLFDFRTGTMYDGVDVYSDYRLASFNFVHMDELSKGGSDRWMDDFRTFGHAFESNNSSTGEGVKIALSYLFRRMFDKNANLKFPIEKIIRKSEDGYNNEREKAKAYLEYIKKHEIPFDSGNAEFTVIMDEPDRNLDIFNIEEVYGILSHKKEQTQIVSVVHNPLLIYRLSKCNGINFIEMEDGYVNRIKKEINNIVQE